VETDILLDNLNMFLSGKSGSIEIDADKLKSVLKRVKSLECALADVLRLTHAKRKKLAA
jgi:hypothetical protein